MSISSISCGSSYPTSNVNRPGQAPPDSATDPKQATVPSPTAAATDADGDNDGSTSNSIDLSA